MIEKNENNINPENNDIKIQNEIFKEQTKIFRSQFKISICLSVIAVFGFILGVVALIYSSNANDLAAKANIIADQAISTQITPVVMVQLSPIDKKRYELRLFNSGHGTAVDVNIDVHLSDTSPGNDGDSGYLYVDLAFKLEHKDRNFIDNIFNLGDVDSNYLMNPPKVLQPGGRDWIIGQTPLHLLNQLFIVIDYKDISGKKYRSIWDGYSWSHSGGDLPLQLPTICKNSDFNYNYRIPGYVLSDVISVAKQALYPDGHQDKWLKEEFESGRPIALYRHFVSWLREEALFFEDQGCGNSLDYFEQILSKAGEELSSYYP